MDRAVSQTSPPRFSFKIACLAALFLMVVFVVGNQSAGIQKTHLHWWTDLWWTSTSLTAALLCLRVARGASVPHPRAWFLFSLGCFSWAFGMIAWDVYELALNWITPFPSLADLGYTGFSILILLGTYSLADSDPSFYERSRIFVDSLILINVLALGLVVLFYDPVLHSPMSMVGKLTALFYPILPLAASYVLWTVRGRMEAGRERRSLDWVLAGMILTAAANMGYLVPIITGGYEVGSLLDPLWVGAFLCIGLGALKIRFESGLPPQEAARGK